MLFPTALAWLLFQRLRLWKWLQRTPVQVPEKSQEPLPRVVWIGLAAAMVWAFAALSFLWWINALVHQL